MKKYIVYTDTNSGNKLRAIKNIARKTGLLEIPKVEKFKEPKIQENVLTTENEVEDAAIRRCYRPSVELQIPTGSWLIGIQKGFYDDDGIYYLIHIVALSESGNFEKPIIVCSKVKLNKKMSERLKASKQFTSPIPLYEQLTGVSEIKWYESTIEKAIKNLLEQKKSIKQKAIHL